MPCLERILLTGFADGELDVLSTGEVEKHLAACADCRKFAEEMREVSALGRTSLCAINVPAQKSRVVIPLKPLHRRVLPALALAAASVALLGVAAALWPAKIRKSVVEPRESVESDIIDWRAPKNQDLIPMVSAEEAGSYKPPPIAPFSPLFSTR